MNSDVIDAVEAVGEPVVTLGEVADEIGRSKGAVGTRLKELHQQGRINRKKVGAKAVVWWLPENTKKIKNGEERLVTS